MQVKKKMTCEDFIRNNRGINNGENLPPDFLTGVYNSVSHNEIRIESEGGPGSGLNPLLWEELELQLRTPRGTLLSVPGTGGRSDVS